MIMFYSHFTGEVEKIDKLPVMSASGQGNDSSVKKGNTSLLQL